MCKNESIKRTKSGTSWAKLAMCGLAAIVAGTSIAADKEEGKQKIVPVILDLNVVPDAHRKPPLEYPKQKPLEVKDAAAKTEKEMKGYTEAIPGTYIDFDMAPIPGGTFTMGSPESEDFRKKDEGPQIKVQISPFWMGKKEVRWDEYFIFNDKLDVMWREQDGKKPSDLDKVADTVSRPTPPYTDMTFDMGSDGYPAISMTQHAAKQYCKWLSMKTGRFYRLPTEAEWEYACRAGTTSAYSFGNNEDDLEDFGWWFDNAEDQYQKVGKKKPNPWGLYDMHGNVWEWCTDGYSANWYAQLAKMKQPVKDPVNWPTAEYPRVARGGGWDDDPDSLRSAARRASHKKWKVQDPQIPKSIWYHTNARWLGFRVVRPLVEPSDEMKAKFWEADLSHVQAIQNNQRKGGR